MCPEEYFGANCEISLSAATTESIAGRLPFNEFAVEPLFLDNLKYKSSCYCTTQKYLKKVIQSSNKLHVYLLFRMLLLLKFQMTTLNA